MTETTVFCCCFSIVVLLSETLPVITVPEELHIATMRDDVIDNLSSEHTTLVIIEDVNRKRMPSQIRFAGLLPTPSIATL